jgi:hypothetical protein
VKKALLSAWDQAEAEVMSRQNTRDHQEDIQDSSPSYPSQETLQSFSYDEDHEKHDGYNTAFNMRGALDSHQPVSEQDDVSTSINEHSYPNAYDNPNRSIAADLSAFQARLRETHAQFEEPHQTSLAAPSHTTHALSSEDTLQEDDPEQPEPYIAPAYTPSQGAFGQPSSSHVPLPPLTQTFMQDIPAPQPPSTSPLAHSYSAAPSQHIPPQIPSQSWQSSPEPYMSAQQTTGFQAGLKTAVRQAPPSRRRLMVIAGGIAAMIVVLASFNMWRGGSSTGTNDVPLIQADNSPTRIQPQNPGGLDIPNQNKQIYEKPSPSNPSQARVIDNEEQPLDVREAVRSQSGTPQDPMVTGAAETSNLLGEPRKVRTIAIRPDGTLSNEQSSVPTPPAPALTRPIQASGLNTTGASATTTLPVVVAPPVARSPQPPKRPDERTLEQALADIPPSPSPTVITPVLSRNSGDQQKLQQRVSPFDTTPEPTPDIAAGERNTRTASLPTPSSSAGGFGIQLAAPASEQEARNIFASLQGKHTLLKGYSPNIVQAQTGGRSIYRLRVGAMSRDEATALCVKLKANGGQCFVAKN